jgi:hypothetical protein
LMVARRKRSQALLTRRTRMRVCSSSSDRGEV